MMLLCKHCVEEIRSRGEIVFVNIKMKYDAVESEAMDITCEWCDEPDDLYECTVDTPW